MDTLDINSIYTRLKEKYSLSFDVVIEKLETNSGEALICYVDSLISKDFLHRDIITAFKSPNFDGNIFKSVNAICKEESDETAFESSFLDGYLGIFYNGKFFICDIKMLEKRSISSPEAENVTRGPKEGFTESVITNVSLLRRRIKSPNFVLESLSLGKQTKTSVIVAYMSDIVDHEMLDKIKERLNKINVDAVMESGKIEQLIEDKNHTLISGIGITQRPDVACARVLEGRIAIICDGTPHILTIPELFIENVQTIEDYNNRIAYATFLRILRVFGLLISIMLPGIAVAILTFHQEMLSSSFLSQIIASVLKTPFPEAIEIFFLMIMIELLKESGIRLPRSIGSSVSIIGGLIIGDAAVRAGIVSATTVIIVALTAISSFIVPNLNEFCTVSRFIFLFLGSFFGIIGIGAGIVLILVHLTSINSFGVPIMSFFSQHDLKDTFIRVPLNKLKTRPSAIAKNNITRIGD